MPAGFRSRGCQRLKMEKASAGGCSWVSTAQALFLTFNPTAERDEEELSYSPPSPGPLGWPLSFLQDD